MLGMSVLSFLVPLNPTYDALCQTRETGCGVRWVLLLQDACFFILVCGDDGCEQVLAEIVSKDSVNV